MGNDIDKPLEDQETEDQAEFHAQEQAASSYHAGFVALLGQPNAGKSTLMNRILGVDLAIVTAKPQTTRNRILGVRTFPEKGQICFVDTPGIHQARKTLNRRMVAAALSAIDEVDLVCHVIDAEAFAHQTRSAEQVPAAEAYILEKLSQVEQPVLVLLNKIDRFKDKNLLLPVMAALGEHASFARGIIPVSATKGDGAREVVDAILAHLPAGGPVFDEDMLTDQAERFLAAEFVREQVLQQTHEEVPYSVAVEIERFVENRARNMLEISAIIHVERASQKGIVIGKGGQRLQSIGEKSRRRMQAFFGKKVHLETFVRVESEWSEDPKALDRFGYE